MKKPSVRFLVASPSGDIPVQTSRLDYPLEGDPLKTPYRLYFQSINDFLIRDNFSPLLKAINEQPGLDMAADAVNELIIRTEKHGALYHPASVEVLTTHQKSVKFALNVAITKTGREALQQESSMLKRLHKKFALPYIPKPYDADELNSMFFLLEEWFEDYHEFHLSRTEPCGQQVKLWEYGKGDRFLTSAQSSEIYRQAAQILTLYYDLKDFRSICPWHHAAGDFIVKISDSDQIDVRLTTVRGYEPFMGHDEDDLVNPAVALFYFLLHVSIQMRLDRFDGVGDLAWADDFCVDATLKGFFQGLTLKHDFRKCYGSPAEFIQLLQSFNRDDLGKTFAYLLDQYSRTKDFLLTKKYLNEHIEKLYLTLQNCP